MDLSFEGALTLFEEYKTLAEQTHPPLDKCKDILDKLKLAVTKFTFSVSTNQQDPAAQKKLLLCREILESGAYLSIRTHDIPSFDRYIAQLKTFYYDYRNQLPPSSQEFPLLGVNLLRLLAKQHALDEFHTELELIPIQAQSNIYIKYPIQLEQWMMEGAYSKVVKAKAQIPAETYSYFLDLLMQTVRDEIAKCIEKAYEKLSVHEAIKLLAFSTSSDVDTYAVQRQWHTVATPTGERYIVFHKETKTSTSPTESKSDIPSLKLIQQTLHYARELERIV